MLSFLMSRLATGHITPMGRVTGGTTEPIGAGLPDTGTGVTPYLSTDITAGADKYPELGRLGEAVLAIAGHFVFKRSGLFY